LNRETGGLLIAALIAAGLALGAGCGDDDDESSDAPAAPASGAASGAEAAAVEEYRRFAVENADEHAELMAGFMEAVEAGDVDEAKELYPDARMPWERIEPIAGIFGDLDPALDAREGDVPKDTWGGWHYFEKALWVKESTEGLEPYIEESTADAATLREAAATVELTAADIAQGAVDLLGEVSASKITGEEERYSHTDLWDFQANVEGSEAAFEAVAPLVDDQALVAEVDERFGDVGDALDAYRDGDGFVLYTDLTKSDTRELSQAIDALAEPLSQVAGQV
jgi:iron uptake system component EfeO